MTGSGGEIPGGAGGAIWDDIVKKLQQKEYTYDAGTYGSLVSSRRRSRTFITRASRVGAYPGAADALRMVAERGIAQGLLADGQCFTLGQLQRCFRRQDPGFDLAATIPSTLRVVSSDKKARKPSETLFRAARRRRGASTRARCCTSVESRPRYRPREEDRILHRPFRGRSQQPRCDAGTRRTWPRGRTC